MSVPNQLPRFAALALGIGLVTAASVAMSDPILRTALVWLGVVPILWGLYGIWEQKMLAEAAELAAEPRSSQTSPPAQAQTPTSKGPAVKEAEDEPARAKTPASTLAAGGPRSQGEVAQGSGFTGERPAPSRPDQRQYLALRRLTEQYLKEVRRMNLIAIWGREGTIGRKQALDEISQIETRMRNLTERMKFAAGRLEE